MSLLLREDLLLGRKGCNLSLHEPVHVIAVGRDYEITESMREHICMPLVHAKGASGRRCTLIVEKPNGQRVVVHFPSDQYRVTTLRV
jgi:hypothetical protein